MEKKVILSGIQATGDLHLGNYIGALKRFVKMQEEYNCYYMVANLHALTVRREPEELKQNILKGLRPQSFKPFDCYSFTLDCPFIFRYQSALLYMVNHLHQINSMALHLRNNILQKLLINEFLQAIQHLLLII